MDEALNLLVSVALLGLAFLAWQAIYSLVRDVWFERKAIRDDLRDLAWDCLAVLGAIALGIAAFLWLQGILRYAAWMLIAVYAANLLSRRQRRL
jgi:hypothetical protein